MPDPTYSESNSFLSMSIASAGGQYHDRLGIESDESIDLRRLQPQAPQFQTLPDETQKMERMNLNIIDDAESRQVNLPMIVGGQSYQTLQVTQQKSS